MYKLVIVDDNLIAREGMRCILDWEKYDIQIVAVCENGQEAWDYIQENDVDIIISDVEMPIMNGIELLKNIRNSNKDVKFLFMSCYDEFDFVKSAIDMDATGYILKPVVEEELENAILKILNIYKIQFDDEEQKRILFNMLEESLPVLRENFFRELMLGIKKNEEQIEEELDLLKLHYEKPYNIQIVLIKIYEHENNSLSYDKDNIIAILAIKDMIKTLCGNGIYANSVNINNTCLAVAFIYKKLHSENIMDVYIKIKEYCKGHLGLNTSFGISKESHSLQDVDKLFKQADIAVNTKLYSEDDRIILFDEVETMNENFDDIIDMKILQKEVKKIIADCDIELAKKLLDKYLSGQKEYSSENFVKCFSYLLRNETFCVKDFIIVYMCYAFIFCRREFGKCRYSSCNRRRRKWFNSRS